MIRNSLPSRKVVLLVATALAGAFLLQACAPYQAHKGSVYHKQRGKASWYGPGFAGRKTANGERFNPNQLTAAHKKLPFNTTVRVTNLDNDKSVIVRINDRGPYAGRRIIDLSKAAAKKIDLIGKGVAMVQIETVRPGAPKKAAVAKKDSGKSKKVMLASRRARRNGVEHLISVDTAKQPEPADDGDVDVAEVTPPTVDIEEAKSSIEESFSVTTKAAAKDTPNKKKSKTPVIKEPYSADADEF
jgi:rare lipoprotein A